MDEDGQIHEQIRAVAAHDDDLRQCAEKDTDMVWAFNRGELACVRGLKHTSRLDNF